MGVVMDPVWMHMLVNHIPIIVPVVGLLIVIVGMVAKQENIKRTGLVVFIASGLTIYVANLTGEPAEHKVKQIPGISKHQIHEHEEASELMLNLMSGALLLALLNLFRIPKSPIVQKWVLVALLVVGVATMVQGVITGHQGGLIRRPDLGGTAPPGADQPTTPNQSH